MNRAAEGHLAAAEGYVAKGDGFYRKAAEEMRAAQEADPTLSNREIAERIGRNESWVRAVLRSSSAPFSEAAGKPNRDLSGARKVFREAPMEQVEQILGSLPKERRQQVAAAAGHGYSKARVEYDEKERNLTQHERQQREMAAERLSKPIRQATAGFKALGIVGHLEQATEELQELVADDSVTDLLLKQIEQAMSAFATEMEVARGMAGLGSH